MGLTQSLLDENEACRDLVRSEAYVGGQSQAGVVADCWSNDEIAVSLFGKLISLLRTGRSRERHAARLELYKVWQMGSPERFLAQSTGFYTLNHTAGGSFTRFTAGLELKPRLGRVDCSSSWGTGE